MAAFPTRYPHWRFGMEYEQLSKGYTYGLQKIYELVINNDPCYAYLMKSNAITDQKLVMAHVYGHCDFFKNNAWFSCTDRKMMDHMANHGNRIRRLHGSLRRRGGRRVHRLLLEHRGLDRRALAVHQAARAIARAMTFARRRRRGRLARCRAASRPRDYMDSFVNPPAPSRPSWPRRRTARARKSTFPAEPMRDVMLFMLEHAPLRSWQFDVLSMLRDEAYYFAPQAQTKIMNEGWASYWHSTIMTRQGLSSADVIHYCDHHSGTMATSPGRLNPYKLGIELFRDIEDRWNRGRFGREYEECDDLAAKRDWHRDTGLGRREDLRGSHASTTT